MTRTRIAQLVALTALLFLGLGLAGGWLLAAARAPGAAPLLWAAAVAVILAIAAAGWLLWRFMRGYLLQVRDLAAGGRTLLAANPDLHAKIESRLIAHPDVRDLAGVFEALGDRYRTLREERAEAVRAGRADMEGERNLLAALMAELTEGVVACNLDGQILLYNRNARRLLGGQDDERGGAYIGLGRSLFSVLEREALLHAIDQVEARRSGERPSERPVVVNFVTTAASGLLLRARLAPFADAAGAVRGYVLLVQDLSEGIERSMRRDRLLQTLTERTRGSVAAVRAAIEAIEQFPEMSGEQRARLQGAILQEAQALSDHLGETLRIHAGDLRAQWRLEEMHGSDLLWSIQRRLGSAAGVTVTAGALDETLWLKIDSYSLMQGLSQALRDLNQDLGVQAVALDLRIAGSFAELDLAWTFAAAELPAFETWRRSALTVDDSDGVLSLREVAERHGGEVWVQFAPPAEHTASSRTTAYIRLLLPLAAEPLHGAAGDSLPASSPAASSAMRLASRPEFYDFDLFGARGFGGESAATPLRALPCTVFDTETTGLAPDHDEIISLGAVRIVNGRMLREEIYEQLVDPGRPIPEASIAFHGITDQMVRGQPSIAKVLPRFHRFAHDTVLVGHNVAFDLRMLAVKEPLTGVRFDGPVLDTLLLSAVVHPDAASHSLEAIAARLGLPAVGRHTALGDALLTAEILLHLLPLLEAQGITTLQAALDASRSTYFARLTY